MNQSLPPAVVGMDFVFPCMAWRGALKRGLGLLLVGLLGTLLSACGGKSRESVSEVTGSEAHRAAVVERLLRARTKTLPTPITEAHFLEEQTGDGRLGPSDFVSFMAFRVPPESLGRWMALFGEGLEPGSRPEVVSPVRPCAWWAKPEEFPNLRFHGARDLTGRANSWAGVDPVTGRIFIYSFTM